jgi:hypothetical protein
VNIECEPTSPQPEPIDYAAQLQLALGPGSFSGSQAALLLSPLLLCEVRDRICYLLPKAWLPVAVCRLPTSSSMPRRGPATPWTS